VVIFPVAPASRRRFFQLSTLSKTPARRRRYENPLSNYYHNDLDFCPVAWFSRHQLEHYLRMHAGGMGATNLRESVIE
jgi:hypothetical protein